MIFMQKIRNAWSLLRIRELACATDHCPLCGTTLIVKLASTAISVRCIRCGASAIHLSIMQVLNELYPDISGFDVYEMSSRGPLFTYLRRRAGRLFFSEYYDDVAPGEFSNGVQCQDVARLTYADASFDLCTSTEVFEHVADDRQGFREICRVLRSGGRLVFTVPLTGSGKTVERAVMVDGEIRHFLEPEYHGDAIRGQGRVLCFRNYGRDILQRLRDIGFRESRLVPADPLSWWGLGTEIVVATK